MGTRHNHRDLLAYHKGSGFWVRGLNTKKAFMVHGGKRKGWTVL